MKRLLSILLALTMLLSLTACGGGNDAAPGGGAVLCLLGVLPGGGRAPAHGGGDAAGLLALWGLPVLGGLLVLWAVMTQSRRYPQGNRDLLGRITAPVNRGLDALRSRLSLSGWEGTRP